jgi:hypothetical protein
MLADARPPRRRCAPAGDLPVVCGPTGR